MNATRLNSLLRRYSGRQLRADLGRLAAQALAALLLLGLAAVVIDAVLGLGAWGLWTLDLILLAATAAALIGLLVMLAGCRFEPRRVAVAVEERLGLGDSRLINAVDLVGAAPFGASVSLRQRAVELGNDLAESVQVGSIVETRRLTRAGFAAVSVLAFVAIIYLLMPGLFHAVVPRLLAPGADLPPFTLLKFDVSTDPQDAYYGKPASIVVKLTGPTLPQRATVVFVADEGGDERIAMVPTVAAQLFARGAKPRESDDGATYRLQLARVVRSRTFYVDTPKGRSGLHQLNLLPVPLFEQVEVNYGYPQYTGWEATTQVLGDGGIKALANTAVTLTVKSNVALGRGDLTMTPSPSSADAQPISVVLDPDSTDPTIVRGTARLNFSGEYSLSLTGADGTASDKTLRGPIVAVPDQLPEIQITEPTAHVVAPEGWKVDVLVEAQDDIGIGRMVLHRGVNGWGPTSWELSRTFTTADHSAASADYSFNLGELGARSGDVITYFATAYDNHPSGGQFAETPIHVIQVISQEEYVEFARTRYHIEDLQAEWEAFEAQLEELREQREAILDQLKELMEDLAGGDPLTDEQKRRLEELEAALGQYAEDAKALQDEADARVEQPSLYDFEKPYKQTMGQMSEGLESQAEAGAALREAAAALRNQDSPALRNQLGARGIKFADQQKPFTEKDDQQREETTVDLEKLALADEMIAQAERIRVVVEAQQGLAQRMAVFRHKNDLSLGEQLKARRLADEQAQLRLELTDAQQSLREAAKGAQENLPKMSGAALGICSAIDGLEVYADMHSGERLANAGQGRGAYEAFQTAADKLDSLLTDSCSPKGGAASGDLDGCLTLPRFAILSSLQQMAQGRGIPGLGPAGATGSGQAGSAARFSVMGPASRLTGGPSMSDRGSMGRGGHGLGKGAGSGDGDGDEGVERIDAPVAGGRGGGSGALLGVPAAYRDQAEAYFQRLAEENR